MADTRTTSELMARDREIGNEMDGIRWPIPCNPSTRLSRTRIELQQAQSERQRDTLLAERRTIRQELERRRAEKDKPSEPIRWLEGIDGRMYAY